MPSVDSTKVMRIAHVGLTPLRKLLTEFGLRVKLVPEDEDIPGSHWGDDEAGLIQNTLYVRLDTPIHSALHEACHWLLMDNDRRETLHTDAGGTAEEENAVCYLQIVLSESIAGFGRERCFDDMDAWGYSFRLGSTRDWFFADAEDAQAALAEHIAQQEPRLKPYWTDH